MRKILFIGYDFHNKTKSSDFLVNLLAQRYDVEVVRINPNITEKELKAKIKCCEYHTLIVWQVFMKNVRLKRVVRFQHGLFFPMYDNMPGKRFYNRAIWRFRDFTIFSFCKAIYSALSKKGFDVRYIQYAPENLADPSIGQEGDPYSIFFWRRRREISLSLLDKLKKEYPLKRIYLHNVPDPGVPMINPDYLQSEGIQTGNWFEDKNDLLAEIRCSALYLAPRPNEGIGMSFLDAMAQYRCVIAPDSPTMNEYIKDGETGILYDPAAPCFSFTVSDVQRIQAALPDYMRSLQKKWEEDSTEIFNVIENGRPSRYSFLRCLLFIQGMFFWKTVKIVNHLLMKCMKKMNVDALTRKNA